MKVLYTLLHPEIHSYPTQSYASVHGATSVYGLSIFRGAFAFGVVGLCIFRYISIDTTPQLKFPNPFYPIELSFV